MSEHLHHKLSVLHQQLLHGKLPRDLKWGDAVELIGHLGEVQPHGGEEFLFVVGSQRDLFKRPHNHEMSVDEVSRLRKFLKAAGNESSTPTTNGEADSKSASTQSRLVVVIDHHSAKIFGTAGAATPPSAVSIKPYDPHGFHHHLIHRREGHYQGGRVPEDTSFYEEVAVALASAQQIVLIGHGTGKSSAVGFLKEYLATHHAQVSHHVTAVELVDLSALSEAEIEAIARKHMQSGQ